MPYALLEALLPVAHGRDTFVRMPTGGGKTLCMFLVPLSISCDAMGTTISPLVGLTQQQVCTFLLILMRFNCMQLKQVNCSTIPVIF